MTIKDKIAALGAARDLQPDAYLARALNRHGVAGMAERLNCSRTTVHQICADLNIRWVYLSVPPDSVIIVQPKAGDAYQTDGRLAKEDPPPTDMGTSRMKHHPATSELPTPASPPPDTRQINSQRLSDCSLTRKPADTTLQTLAGSKR